MLQVNLSNLSGPELRRLLDATRSRGEAALSYQILQEMAARREDGGRRAPFHMRRPAEPRVISVDLSDPMERTDDVPPMPPGRRPVADPKAQASPPPKSQPEPEPEPTARRSRKAKAHPRRTAAPAAQVEAEPAPPPELERPLIIDEALQAPPEDEAASSKDWDVRLRPPEPDSHPAPRRFRRGHAAGFAVGAAAGVALGWWIGMVNHEAPPMSAARAATPVRTAALARPPQPAPTPVVPAATTPEPAESAPEPTAEPVVAAVTPDLPETPVAAPAAAPVAPDVDQKATGEAMELPQTPEPPKKAEETKTAKGTAANACAAQPTPADRQICASPELRRLQRELRRAYADALQAHQDRALLREHQLAWREARNGVSDPDRLAKLYEQRIRKLNAATAEARRQR